MQLGLNQHGRRDGHAQAGGGRFQHVPQMIEFAAGMTRGQLHADAAGPVLPGLGPRAGVQQRRVQHVGRTRQAGGSRLARRPGRWPRPAAASRPTRAANRGRPGSARRRAGCSAGGVRRGLQADADVGMRGLETLQPGMSQLDRKLAGAPTASSEGWVLRLSASQRRSSRSKASSAARCRSRPAAVSWTPPARALEQRAVEPLLQLPDLLADGAVRHAQLLAARLKLSWRAALSKKRSAFREGRRLMIRLLAQLTVMINKSLI